MVVLRMLRLEPDITTTGHLQYQVSLMSRQAKTSKKDFESSLDRVKAQGCTVVRVAIVIEFFILLNSEFCCFIIFALDKVCSHKKYFISINTV